MIGEMIIGGMQTARKYVTSLSAIRLYIILD